MSQSDEHESAIIENENNSNKVMESQGALGSSAADRSDFILADTSSLPHSAGSDDDCESQEEEGMDMDINEGSAGESKSEDMNVVREEDTMGVEPTDQSGADGEEESMSDYAKGDAEESMLESVTGDAEEMPGLPEEMASTAADEARTEHSTIKNHLDEDANEMDVDHTSAQEPAAEEEGEEREAMGEADEAEWSREGMATASVDDAEGKEHTVTAENVSFAEMAEGVAWGKEEGQTHLRAAAASPDVSRKDELKDISKFRGDEVEANVSGETEVEAPQEEAIDNEKQSEEKLSVSESRVQSTLSAEVEDTEQDDVVMGEDLVMKKQMDEDDYALQSVGQVEDSTVTSEEEDKLLSNEESQHTDDRNRTKDGQTDKQAIVDNVTAAVKMDSVEEKKQEEAEEIEAEAGRCADDETEGTDFGQKDDLLGASVEASKGQGQGDNEKGGGADNDIHEDAGDQAEKAKHSTSESCVVGEAGDVCPDGDDVMPSYTDAMTNQGDADTVPEMAAVHREGIVEGEKSKERVARNQSEKESSAEKQSANNKDDSSSMEADEPSEKTGEQVPDFVPQTSKAVDKKETKGEDDDDDDDDVVVLDDDDETIAPAVKKEALDRTEDSTALFNSSNDMGIQIESVSGGADELHDLAEQPSRQENGMFGTAVEPKKESSGVAGSPSAAKRPAPKTQMCIVCKRVGKCKYNIVRNGDIKHLCDDVCFQRFRTNPTLYLKGTAKKEPALAPASANQPSTAGKSGQTVAGYKTCVVCQLMNINTQGQFCMWKGLDFCGENCLGKFQANLATSCATCAGYIPLTARSANCLRIGSEVRPFCSQRCYLDYKQRMRLCAFCQKDLSSASDSFSAPVGSEGVFKDFCSQICMKKYEDLLSNDVEIIRVEQGKVQPSNKCSVCQKVEVSKHTMKYGGQIHHLCSDPCLSAFQYANKLNMNSCDQCSALCTTLESSPHLVQFEGQQKRFCSDACVNIFRTSNRKVSPCAWCGSEKSNFDMIERLDSNNKFQLFCSLNCLSLYRVNLQAKSNQSVTCDQCLKFVPAQYHLTMSDASVRNFCSYTCVMTFQSQFTSKAVPPPPKSSPDTAAKHRHNTRGNTQQATNQPSFPIISNVVSLAPQGGQKVNIKSPAGIPVVVSGSSQTIKIKNKCEAAMVRGACENIQSTSSVVGTIPPSSYFGTRCQKALAVTLSRQAFRHNSDLPVESDIAYCASQQFFVSPDRCKCPSPPIGTSGDQVRPCDVHNFELVPAEFTASLTPVLVSPAGSSSMKLPGPIASLYSAANRICGPQYRFSQSDSSAVTRLPVPPISPALAATIRHRLLSRLPLQDFEKSHTENQAAGVASTPGGLVQQHIIIQPPPPKVVKNKSLLCKPFVQTKATSCRPHTQTCATQTDDVKTKPTLIPVPVPIYLPVPCAMYTAPTPTPVFIPIPIPVPVFIPTTRRSASGIMKHIKEIQEKIPTDPLEAEILMMAAAVATDGKHSSDSETDDDDMLRDIGSKRKAIRDDDEDDENDADVMPLTGPKESEVGGEEDMIQMALRMAEEMSGPIVDLESAVEAVPINTEPPPATARTPSPVEQTSRPEHEFMETRSSRGRGSKRASTSRRSSSRTPKRPRIMPQQPEVTSTPVPPEALPPQLPPADANYHLKFTYGVNAWRHWVLFKNAQLERAGKRGSGRIKLFKTDILQCTADELNYSLCLFVKEVRKPSGDEYSPDSIYYLCLGIQQYLFENGRIDNIFTDLYYEKFTECLTDILSRCQPKFNAAGQMVCRIEEEHLWECKQLGAHSPYVLLNTLIYFHTKYFMLKTPEDHMKLSFAHILKYWKKGQPGKGGQPTRSVSLRYYSVSTAKKDGSAPTSTTKKGSKEGIPVYEVTENQDNPLRCPVKLYEFYLSKCPESIKNRSDIFYPVPERSCVPDSPVWYSTTPIGVDTMTKMLTRILLVREIQEAHLHAQPIYV